MKFVKSNESSVTLSAEALQLGKNFELVHSSAWDENAPKSRACWSQTLEPLQMLKYISELDGGSVLQSSAEDFENDVRAWVKIRENPRQYFEHPLQTLLTTKGTFEDHFVEGKEKKLEIRELVNNFGSKHGNVSCQESILAIFEELFMNAVIDAPREAGNPSLQKGARIFLGADESRMGVACQDLYGSLKLVKLLRRLKEVYEQGAGTAINLHGPGGAGLGATIMIEKSSLICFGVIPGQMTTVSCLVHRNLSHRRRAELSKSLHFVVGDSGGNCE